MNTNIAVIGNRNTGKTTYLKGKFIEYLNSGYKVIVVDSATDHKENSIIEYIKNNFENILLIKSPRKNWIFDLNIIESGIFDINTVYPYHLIKNTLSNIICIDVSKYLEEGYSRTENIVLRNEYRMFYKKLTIQCLRVFYEFLEERTIIIMDEIEFIPDMKKIIELYNSKNIYFNAALHLEKSLDNSLKLFEIKNTSTKN